MYVRPHRGGAEATPETFVSGMVLALSVDAALVTVAAAAWQPTVPAGDTSAAEAIAGSRAGQALASREPP